LENLINLNWISKPVHLALGTGKEWNGPLPPSMCYVPPGGLFPLPPPDGLPVVLGPLPPLTPPPLPPPLPPLPIVIMFPFIWFIAKSRILRLRVLYGFDGKILHQK
jgi:hypothetical protein